MTAARMVDHAVTRRKQWEVRILLASIGLVRRVPFWHTETTPLPGSDVCAPSSPFGRKAFRRAELGLQ